MVVLDRGCRFYVNFWGEVLASAKVACGVDENKPQLVVLRKTHSDPIKVAVELVPLDGSAPTLIPLTKVKNTAHPSVTVSDRQAIVTTGSGKALSLTAVNLDTAANVPHHKRKKRTGVEAIPIGSAGDVLNTGLLARLTKPPRKIVKPYHANLRAWANNGVRSFNGKTLAVYDIGPKRDVDLIIAQTKPLKALHRIHLTHETNWLTAFFITDRYLVAQCFPDYWVVDVLAGRILGNTHVGDVRLVGPGLIATPSQLLDARDNSLIAAQRQVDLSLSSHRRWRTVGKDLYLKMAESEPGQFALLADGSVFMQSMSEPDGLHCRFGQWLAPWPVCRHRLLVRDLPKDLAKEPAKEPD